MAKRWREKRQRKQVRSRYVTEYELIKNRLGRKLRFNQILNKPELDGEPFPAEKARLKLVIEKGLPLKSGKDDLMEIVLYLAQKNSYNPVKDYLDRVFSKFGNDIQVLEGLAERYLGNSEPIAQTQLVKTLIRAVARVFEPGCKAEDSTVFQGPQGYQKSEFLKLLASPAWFCDDFNNPTDKDHLLKLHETWIVEWSELSGLTRREIQRVKQFMSCSNDHIRRPYGREAEPMPRPSTIIGTTNDTEFLQDSTGNRRWWVIRVNQKIPLDLVREERDRLWAAAVSLYKGGESWWLNDKDELAAEAARKEFEVVDAWHDVIADFLENREEVSVNQIFTHVLKIDIGLLDNSKRSRVTNILRRLGFEYNPNSVYRNGERVKLWVRKINSKKALSGEGVSGVSRVSEPQNSDSESVSSDTLLEHPPSNF
jgi:predicted P-loop ATPase